MTRLLALVFALALGSTHSASAQEPDVAAAQAAARAHPNDAEVARRLGRTLLRAGRFDEASRAFHRASALRRNAPEALYEEASVAFTRGDFRASRNACRSLQGRHRESVYVHLCLARSFLVLNRSARAFEELALAAQSDPNHYELHLVNGEANRIRMNFAEAEAAYLAAVAVAPDEAAPHLGLGRLYLAAGRRDDALRELRTAASLDANWPEVQAELGTLVGGDEGLELLRRSVRGCGTVASAQVALGELEFAGGRFEPARAAFEAAVRLDEHLAPGFVGLGRALAGLGRDAEAEAALTRALTLVPNSTPSHMTLAEIRARTDRIEDAFEDYRRAADGSPGDPAPLLAGARLALDHGRDTLAQAFLDRLLAMNDSSGDGYALYGDVMVRRRDFAAAVQAYERALRTSDLRSRPAVEASLADARARAAAQPARR